MSDLMANYHGGAATSKDAFQRAEKRQGDRMVRVLRALAEAGERGMTSEQLEDATGISHQSMGGVVLLLITRKSIHRPGAKRRTRSGAEALICFIGPGESVGRAPRDEFQTHAELLQRFADALLHSRLVGPGAEGAKASLAAAGFRGRV